MKFAAGVGGHDPHLFGLFEASDTPENLLLFQSKYMEQIRQLIAFGIQLPQEDGSNRVVEVEVLVCGDKAFISDENGHAGAASSFPSIYRLVTSNHLRKIHLDGSPHNRANPACHFQERTPEGMEKDYHLNLNDQRSGTLRTRGKHHHSIVGPRLLPLRSQYHFCVSSLHIGLMVVLRMMGYMEMDCDLLDGTKSGEDAASLEARFEVLEGLTNEISDDDETDDELDIDDTDDELTDVMRANKVQREILEVQWQAKSLDVLDMVSKQKEMTEQICEKMLVLERIQLMIRGDKSGVEKIAKKTHKSRYSLKTFGKWTPRNSWQCDLCLLTGFDREIQWKVCSSCQRSTHIFCQVLTDEELASSLDHFQCQACIGVLSYDQVEKRVAQEITDIQILASNFSVEVAKSRKEESKLEQECSKFMGATRLRLQDILEKDLKVNRSEYHSSCFVGNHCDKIVEKFEKITEVFASNQDVKRKYDEFFKVYKPIHFLMKAKRFLTPEELDQLDNCCEKIGIVYPKNFRKSIPPKLDDLIFVVPKFARLWGTVGGLREENIEAFHNIANRILRILCCVRKKDLQLVQMMERVELKQNLVTDFAKPVPRKLSCPTCTKAGKLNVILVEKTCTECGYKKE